MRQTPHVYMVYVRLLTVLSIALGAWSMALVLWQPPEYYYVWISIVEEQKLTINFSVVILVA